MGNNHKNFHIRKNLCGTKRKRAKGKRKMREKRRKIVAFVDADMPSIELAARRTE